MHSFVLQDFITIRGSSTTQTITQSEQAWIEMSPYEDLVAWIDVREVTTGGASFVQFNLQTAPIRDEYLFVTMETAPLTLTAALTAPSVRKYLMSQATGGSGPPVPLSRYLRWQLVATGATATWDAVFRIVVSANAVGAAAMHPQHHK